MSQQTVLPASETKTVSEVPVDKKVFPKIVPPQVAVEIADSGKKTINQFVAKVVATWRALPLKTKRTITFVGLSVFVSVTMSLIATVIARVITWLTASKSED
jgi:hypothetical protein